MAPPSQHLCVELFDRLAAGAHERERQERVQQAGEPRQDHPTPEIRRMHQVLPVALAYRFGVLGK
jgi:hypothetical protein